MRNGRVALTWLCFRDACYRKLPPRCKSGTGRERQMAKP